MRRKLGKSGIATQLHELKSDNIGVDEFVRRTTDDWNRIAETMIDRWAVPAGVEVSDVRQELIIAALTFVDKYDSSRGVAFDRYVIWNAYDKGIKWIHKQRGTRKTHAARTIPLSFMGEGWLSDEIHSAMVEETLPSDAGVHRIEALATAYSRLTADTYRIVFDLLIEHCDVAEVVRVILDNPRLRVALHVSDEHGARRLAFRVMRKAVAPVAL